MKTLTVAVIGTGYVGSIHARLWAQAERARLVGVYDVDEQRARQLATELNVVAFSTLEDALAAAEAVTVAVPTRHHAEVTLQALAAGKHVLIEKPVAATIEEAEAICMAAEQAGTVVCVAHVERFNPAFQHAQRYVHRPLFIEVHRLSPFRVRGADVSVIGDLMIHDLDLVRTLVGRPVVRMEAHGVAVISSSIDIANARIEFDGGCVANLTASRLTPQPLRKLRIFQPNAYMSIDFAKPELELYRLVEGLFEPNRVPGEISIASPTGKAIVYEQPELPAINAIEEEHRAFIASILDGAPPVVSLADGVEALRLASAIERAVLERMAQLTV